MWFSCHWLILFYHCCQYIADLYDFSVFAAVADVAAISLLIIPSQLATSFIWLFQLFSDINMLYFRWCSTLFVLINFSQQCFLCFFIQYFFFCFSGFFLCCDRFCPKYALTVHLLQFISDVSGIAALYDVTCPPVQFNLQFFILYIWCYKCVIILLMLLISLLWMIML